MFHQHRNLALTAVVFAATVAGASATSMVGCKSKEPASDKGDADKEAPTEQAKSEAKPGSPAAAGTDVTAKSPTTPGTADDTSKEGIDKHLAAAEESYAKLQEDIKAVQQRITAEGKETRGEIEKSLREASDKAKAKLDAARKASADNARSALDDLDKALDDLRAKVQRYSST